MLRTADELSWFEPLIGTRGNFVCINCRIFIRISSKWIGFDAVLKIKNFKNVSIFIEHLIEETESSPFMKMNQNACRNKMCFKLFLTLYWTLSYISDNAHTYKWISPLPKIKVDTTVKMLLHILVNWLSSNRTVFWISGVLISLVL